MNRSSDVLARQDATPAGGALSSLTPEGRALLAAAAVACAYALTARLGAVFAFAAPTLSALWLPNAILMAALLLTRRRSWGLWLAAGLPAHLLVQVVILDVALPRALLQYLGNGATALLGAWLLLAFAPGLRRIDSLRHAVAFVLLGAVLAPLGTSVLVAALYRSLRLIGDFTLLASLRTLTNAFAVLTLVPLILHGVAWLRQPGRSIPHARVGEASLLTVALLTLGLVVFDTPGEGSFSAALLYAPFALLLWAAMRFGVPGASASTLLLGMLATWGATHHTGPFGAPSAGHSAISLLAFLVLTSASLLLLSAALEERHLLQRAESATEARFRTMFAYHPVPTVIWHTDGHILDANDAFFKLTGYQSADLGGRLPLDALLARSSDESGAPPTSWLPRRARANSPIECELILRHGQRIPVLVAGCRFPGSSGEGMAYVFDLSSLRQAEAERRTVQALHSAVLASVHDQVIVLDQAGIIIEANQSWRQFAERLGPAAFEHGEVGCEYLRECEAAAARGDLAAVRLRAEIGQVLDDASTHRRLELTQDSPEGPLTYEISIERLRRPEGGVVLRRTDSTAQHKASIQAREQREQLAHLARAAVLGELSGAFAHELAQPLTAILGNAEAALQLLRAGPENEELREILGDIVRDDVRAAEVIRRLRSMLARGEIQRRAIDLNEIVAEVLALTRGDLISRNVSVATQLAPHGALVCADAVQMQQVLLNLIINSCDAMGALPAAARQLTIATRSLDNEGTVECSVADCGSGIAEADTERIFQPFFTTKARGLGLGLAICRSIIEAHGGRLWAESAAAECGATLRFALAMHGEQSHTQKVH
jgi:PAS domain S-box-containing protein